MDNKNIFAYNLKRYMELHGRSRNDISEALHISYFTVSDWVNGKKYPRMDKVEMLANYFGIQKSDLIESHADQNELEDPKLTKEEKEWLDFYHKLSEESRCVMIEMMNSIDKIPQDKQQFALQVLKVTLDYKE